MKPATLLNIALLLVFAAPVAFSASGNQYDPAAGPVPRFAVFRSRSGFLNTNDADDTNDANGIVESPRGDDQYILDAINHLGIRYARGRGVAKDSRAALKMFKMLAVEGYTPGMVNLGIAYELGLSGRHDHRRAYAWIRAALALGVPQEDYEATIFKLGVVVGKLGTARLGSADRLAADIVKEIISRRKSPAQVHAQDSAIAKFP
jgi:TPR repeat protein